MTGGTNQPSPSGGFQHPSLSSAYDQRLAWHGSSSRTRHLGMFGLAQPPKSLSPLKRPNQALLRFSRAMPKETDVRRERY